MEKSDDERRDEPPKLPYEKPEIVESAEFETLAMACAKTPGVVCRRGGQFS